MPQIFPMNWIILSLMLMMMTVMMMMIFYFLNFNCKKIFNFKNEKIKINYKF
uniref:ATP synthase subunit 8 n=1 Tax=Rhipicephalus decoloratus TaxID=60189 RepID=A0A7G9TYM2_RHIDE|nr:ATP synthase F0 subunit 8 [Rhipicephalus decoloratus]QNN85498.1 ATP synthase subunit 8 [Rhipicephalus decoloratus]